MANESDADIQRALSPAFSMWKTFRSTVTVLYRNLENAENNLQAFVNTILSSPHFSDIFIPCYEPSLSLEDNQSLEKKYQVFTTWFLGRLFYILSYDKYERIHDLYINAQLRILDILKTNQPHVYNAMVSEYNSALTQLNDYLKSIESEAELLQTNQVLMVKIFDPDDTVITKQDLELTQKFVQINSMGSALILQRNVLRILTQSYKTYIDSFWMDPLSQSIFSNIVYTSENSPLRTKIIVLEFFVESLDTNYFQFEKPALLHEYYRKINTYVEALVNALNLGTYDLNINEIQQFEKILCKFFSVAVECKIINDDSYFRTKYYKMCESLFQHKLRDTSTVKRHEELVQISMHLMKTVLENANTSYSDVKCLLEHAREAKECASVDVLLEYQIFYELHLQTETVANQNSVTINVFHLSATWKALYTDILMSLESFTQSDNAKMIYILKYVLSVLELTQRCYVSYQDWIRRTYPNVDCHMTFLPNTNIPNRLIEITGSCDKEECLNLIMEIFACIISFHEFLPNNMTNFKNMIEIILYPYRKIISLSQNTNRIAMLFINSMSEESLAMKQQRSLEIVSNCMMNTKYRREKCNVVQDWLLTICKSCVTENRILNQVAESLPYFLCTTRILLIPLFEILVHLLASKNNTVLKTLSSRLGTIICILRGQFIETCDIDDKRIKYVIYCSKCDLIKVSEDGNDEKTMYYRKRDKKTYSLCQFPSETDFPENVILPAVLKLIESEEVVIRRNISGDLPRYLRHISTFNTKEVSKHWLNFIMDTDEEVRANLVESVRDIVQDYQNDVNSKFLENCLDIIENSSPMYSDPDNVTPLETSLDIIKHIGCVKNVNILYPSTKLLLCYILLCSNNISIVAVDYLHSVAKSHDLTPNLLYIKYKNKFCRILAGMSVVTYLQQGCSIIQSLEKMSLAFSISIKELLGRDCHHILPHFISLVVDVPQCKPILNDIADLISISQSALLVTNFSYIYTHIYLNEEAETHKKCMQYIEEITQNKVSVLRRRTVKIIHNELLMHCHDKRELVINELYVLSLEDNNQAGSSKNTKKVEVISTHLQPRFLGVLVYFDAKLVSKNVSESVKIRVLQSLPELIKLMGAKFVTSVRFKIVNTLRTASTLVEQQYLALVYNCWDAFVRGCEVESLGSLLSTIYVSMLPLIPIIPHKVNAILRYLVIENEEKIKDSIQDLYVLPYTSISREIINVIKKYEKQNQAKSLKEQIGIILKYINYKNLEVRIHGLKFLKQFMKQNNIELKKLILANELLDPVLVELKDILMKGCREHDEQVKLACGECLGEMGAIDPSQFPRVYTKELSNFTFYITEDIFIVNGLTELLRSFQVEKHTQNMNRFALAIQEILKSYDIAPNKVGAKNNLWANFPENMQELMLPLLSSRYTISSQAEVELTHPIITSNLGATFTDWVDNWLMFLIRIMRNEKSLVLQNCRPCFKQDYRTLMFFLPRIVVHALIECSDEERTLIYNEFMAVLNPSNAAYSLKSNSSEHFRYLKTPQYIPADVDKDADSTNQKNPINVIFVLLDYLDRWLREFERTKHEDKSVIERSKAHYRLIQKFIDLFCNLQIAKCNYMRAEYPRALMYLEQYVSRDTVKLSEQLEFFAKIYTQLDDPDGVYGVMALKETELSQDDMILRHTLTGQFQDAAACYEQMAQKSKLAPKNVKNMIECYLHLDDPYTALMIANGALHLHSVEKNTISEEEAESYWRLGEFDKLDVMLQKPDMKTNTSWGVRIGQALLHFRQDNCKAFHKELGWIRKLLIDKLSGTSLEMGMYGQGYKHIIKLHILNDFEKAVEVFHRLSKDSDKANCVKALHELLEEWELRIKLVQPTVPVLEAILRFRRIILLQAQHVLGANFENFQEILNGDIARSWLKSAGIARGANLCTQAYNYILNAEKYKPMGLFIENAKLCWHKSDHDLAFSTLRRGIEKNFPNIAVFKEMELLEKKAEREICAEAKLLIAMYNEETSNVDMEVNIINYKEAVEIYREWDKSQLRMAQYYEKMFNAMDEENRDKIGADILIHIINCFGKSLTHGTNYIYQSMPRMLSTWLDFGTRIIENKDKDNEASQKHKQNTLVKMIKLIDIFLDRLPAYMFLSAFSQIVSRICHPVREVYLQIKSILIKLILRYPQQCMWRILAVSKSSYAMRSKRCQEVLQDPRLKGSHVIKLIYDFNRIADKLIELCNKPISNAIFKTSVSTLLKTLPRLLQSKEFSRIMLPTQKLLKLVLPNPDYSNPDYDPFPNTCVYIDRIEDEVVILQSLQRPRKITFRGSDGKKYIHMLKPKDDLRKDFRLMEFNDVVNTYLRLLPDSRARRLCIRTYSVVPLNEECGIVEWINNLVGLRVVLMKIYKQKGLLVTNSELRTLTCSKQESLACKRQQFVEKLLPRHPPVLAQWFRQTFPDAHFWYQARSAYIRTCAVMSMVGYILGLGDRHGENILFDTTNGDTVHVDFNCLFNKGESFEWPERVPFRLTHNMVNAMGPMGVEGPFRRSCQVALRILRDNIDTLMSILRPFVYDPLVSWPRHHVIRADDDAERRNDQAVVHIRNIERRLQGMVNMNGKGFSISLSPEGQANNLIQEATSIDNLCQMYVGWGAYL